MNIFRKWKLRKNYQCVVCGQKLVAQSIPSLCGQDGGVSVEFINLPIMRCPENSNHENRYIYSEFGSEVTEFMFYSKTFPIVHVGVLFIIRCYKCGEKINKPVIKNISQITGDVKIDKLSAFTVKVNAPIYTCSHCDSRQVYYEGKRDDPVSNGIANAMSNAFESIKLVP